MQKRQGYCSYCRVQYPNLEQHLFSAQHRSLTRQSRHRTTTNNSLMERFLQDVLRHHPYNYQDNRAAPNEAAAEGAEAAAAVADNDDDDEDDDPGSPEVVILDDSDDNEDDTAESSGEVYSEDSQSVEEIDCRPGTSQECAEVAVRPSVIQRLERGQQQSLELAQRVESGVQRVNSVGVVQATTSGKGVVRPPVICNAPASSLPRGSFERPVAANSVPRLVLAVASDSFPACDTENLEPYFDPPDQGSSNPPSQPKPKDPKKKPLNINLDKLLAQKNLRAKGASFSPVVRVRELTSAELCSLRVESSSESGAGTSGNPSENDTPPDAAREGAIPKRREAPRSNVVHPQEETRPVLNKSLLLKQRRSVVDRGSLQPAPGHSQAAVRDLSHLEEEEEEEEGADQEGESYESRGSDVSFDRGSSRQSLSAQSELTAREISVSEDDVQPRNETPTVSGATSNNGSSSSQVPINRSPVITQNMQVFSLVDESYESSGSEVNFDDDSRPSTSRCPPQPVRAAMLPTQMAVRLVDSYGSGSSEPAEDSGSSADEIPAAVGQQQPPKNASAPLVDENYGSSSFSSDSDVAPQMPVQERSPRDRAVQQEDEHQSSSAEAYPEGDGSVETVADAPQREAEEINVPNQKNTSRGDMNCESHGPEVGFHADARLEAAQSPVNPEEVDLDLENQSVHSGMSNLSFDSHASYQSANNQPQGAWGELNLDELNVDMEVKSNACSSSELTFDSDSPLLSVTGRSLLDFEGINEDFNLEDQNCVSSSSDITFDSDIPDDSVADQPQVAVYVEEPVDLQNKSSASCVSEITYDSDIPLHSGNDHPEVAVKEVIIQEEENAHLEGKNDNPSDSEICLDSNAPLHSVTNSQVAVQKINSPQEEQEQQEDGPTVSGLSLNCGTRNSTPGRSEDPIGVRVSQTRLDSHTPFQSVIRKCEVIVRNVCHQEEKHAQLPGTSTESHSEISSAASTASHPATEPYVGKKAKRKTKHLEEVKSDDEYDGFQPTFSSDVFPQLMTEKPQPAALEEGHADPKDDSTELRGTEENLNTAGCLDSVIIPPQLAVKENHDELEDTHDKQADSTANVDSTGHFDSLPKEDDVITKMNEWKKEAKVLEKKISELIYSKLIHDSNVSFRSTMDHLELALKQINLDSHDQMPLEDDSQKTSSETTLDSDFSVQSVVEPPETTVSEPEHVELEGRNNESGDSEVSYDSNDCAQSEAAQHNESDESGSQKDKDDMEGQRDEAQGFGNTCVSSVPQSLAGQAEAEVIQEISRGKDHSDSEDQVVESSDSNINLHSDEPIQSVTNTTQEAVQEINLLRGHVSPHDSDCEPSGSTIVSVSNVIFCSVIQKPQRLQKECTSLNEKSSSPCGPEVTVDSRDSPETSLDSGEPCQSVAGHLQKTVKEMNLKEDRIYLEDKSYKLVDFEPAYYPDDPVQFVTDPSVEDGCIKEVNLQKENQNDLENETFQPCCSEVACSSGVHLQSEVDPPQVAYSEADPEKKELVIEEKCSESCEPEVLYDSDVSFQIVVNQLQTSDGETDSPQVVFVNVVSSDSDCDREVISDSNIPLQLEPEPPQLTVKETNDINTDSVGSAAIAKYYCKSCGCDYEASQSVTNQSKESFKIINRKNDYIILGDSVCPSCGHELNFSVDASDKPTTSQGPDPNYVDRRGKHRGSQSLKRSFSSTCSSQPVTRQQQRIDEDISLWNSPRCIIFPQRSWESGRLTADGSPSAVSVIRETYVSKIPLKLGDGDLEDDRCVYGTYFECDPDQPLAKRRCERKKVTFDMRVTKYEYIPVPEEGEEFPEGDPNQLVREASPQVSETPSQVGETPPQVSEDEVRTNTQEFQGHVYSYDDCSETKKIILNEEEKAALFNFYQNAPSVHTLPHLEYTEGKVGDTSDFSVAVVTPSCSQAEGLQQQQEHAASENQVEEVRCGTQESSGKKRKMSEQEDDLPKRKHFHQDSQKKKKEQTELPVPQTKEPAQPDNLVYIFSSLSMKEDQSLNPPKAKPGSDKNLQFIHSAPSAPRKKTVINPPQNLTVPEHDRQEVAGSDLSRNDPRSSAGQNGANRSSLISATKMAMPKKRCVLRYLGLIQSSYPENSGVGATATPKDNVQQTHSNQDSAKIPPKPVQKEVLDSKNPRKFWKKKLAAIHQSNLLKNAFKTVVLRKKSKLASEKLAIWIRLKANDVVRKYVSTCPSVPRKLQSKTVLIRRQLRKKKLVARKIKEVKRAAAAARLSLALRPAVAEEHSSAPAPPVELPTTTTTHYRKRRYRRKKKLLPVREYDLRSSSSSTSTDRMVTRLASKSRSNEAK
ncbi:DBF4-type zinc finger-containing protein 2 isoform X2 [Cricetulus griseus]|uniref:DBF4-type zinc finger-containing protein 2 isoform X2 n=1 Tax=Cricetulus griseus TaxID=10029 RepID=A0A9J7GQZ8_CRIGR|nr:DBF4-type zinc finger-containing protein 2 isoform X2 [Cricetulus griseus]